MTHSQMQMRKYISNLIDMLSRELRHYNEDILELINNALM